MELKQQLKQPSKQPLLSMISHPRTSATLGEDGLVNVTHRAMQAPRSLSPSDLSLLQGTIGNQAVGRVLQQSALDSGSTKRQNIKIQAKLTFGQPNDRYEQEADRVAEQVISMAPPTTPNVQEQSNVEQVEIQAKPLAETLTSIVPSQEGLKSEKVIQAKCETCAREEHLQRSAIGRIQEYSQVEERLNASKVGGSPLSDEVRSFMEPRFGADLSQVRIHTGLTGVDNPTSIGAAAYTTGNHVVFGESFYNPSIKEGNRLLAHELTHVIQQGAAPRIQHQGVNPVSVSLKSPSTQPQFGIWSAAKCAYYTWRMSNIFDQCRAEYKKHCEEDMLSDECLQYMDEQGAGNPSDAIFNCARRKNPDYFRNWLKSCAKTATGSYGGSKWGMNESEQSNDESTEVASEPSEEKETVQAKM